MRPPSLRQSLSVILSLALKCPSLPAQAGQQPAQVPAPNASIIKPDPKIAKKYADQGAKLEAAGDFDGALAAYEEAARYAPFDVTIVSKGVALRSRLVREYVNKAESLAIQKDVTGATEALLLALRIDFNFRVRQIHQPTRQAVAIAAMTYRQWLCTMPPTNPTIPGP